MPVEAFGHTDIGKARLTNEDDYLCRALDSRPAQAASDMYLAAVADGIGGHFGGEVASGLAIGILKDCLARTLETAEPAPDFRGMLKVCLEEINREVFRQASRDEGLIGMGLTLVAAFVGERNALIANVGDCRAYLYRDKSLTQITRDHNWKEEQRLSKKFPESEILRSPLRDMVTRSLGFEAEVEVDLFEVDMRARDYLLLCSDGLYRPLGERRIAKIIERKRTPEKICRRLIRMSRRRGGQDNITAVVLHSREEGKGKSAGPSPSDTIRLAPPNARQEAGNDSHG